MFRLALLLCSIAALGACAADTGSPPLDLEGWATDAGEPLPPPGALSLALRGTGELGTVVTVDVTGALPYEEVLLIRGTGGLGEGPCLAAIGGQCLDVRAPITLMGSEWLDVDGAGSEGLPIASSPTLDGAQWCFQGIAMRSGGAAAELSTTACVDLDRDTDGDGVLDDDDVCAGGNDAADFDGDGTPDACDVCPSDSPDDTDGDGVCDTDDPCPLDSPDDTDGDGVCDTDDPCPLDNPDDSDGDGLCDSDDVCAEDVDHDGDGVSSCTDPCPLDALDLCRAPGTWSGTIEGEVFDLLTFEEEPIGPMPFTIEIDADGGMWGSFEADNPAGPTVQVCLHGAVVDAALAEGALSEDDGICALLAGVVGDPTSWSATFAGDALTGAIAASTAEAPFLTGLSTLDATFDLVRDPCDPADDADGDGICDADDACFGDNTTGDGDTDGVCDSDDQCPGDDIDTDGDGTADCIDVCPGPELDTDGDGALDCLDPCPLDALDDIDGDGLCHGDDPCPLDPADADVDGDGICDDEDACIDADVGDDDGDGLTNCTDPCPFDALDLCRAPSTWTGTVEGQMVDFLTLADEAFGPTALTIEVGADGSMWGTFEVDDPYGPPVQVCLYGSVTGADTAEGALVEGHSGCDVQTWMAGDLQQWTAAFAGDTLTGSIGDAAADPAETLFPVTLDATFAVVRDPCDPADDADGDGICDADDPCFGANDTGDTDLDGVCDSDDACEGDDVDTDGDGTADCVDPCPLDPADDTDGDELCDGDDPCPLDPTNVDSDGDGVCDTFDLCPGEADLDTDGDSVCESLDPCPLDALDLCRSPGLWTGTIEGSVEDLISLEAEPFGPDAFTVEIDAEGAMWGSFEVSNPSGPVVQVCLHGAVLADGTAEGSLSEDDGGCDLLAGVVGDNPTWSATFDGDALTGAIYASTAEASFLTGLSILDATFDVVREPCDLADDSDRDGLCDVDDGCFGDNATGDGDADGVCDSDDQCDGPDTDSDGDGIPDCLDR